MNLTNCNLILCLWVIGLFTAKILLATETSVVQPAETPLTNAIQQSLFREMDPYNSRDPFSPIGYKRVPPQAIGPGGKPMVDFKLKINGISIMGDESFATLESGQIVEIGGTYKLKTSDGKATVDYKVLSITEAAVTALYDGTEYQFKPKSNDLENFQEKEETNENTQP